MNTQVYLAGTESLMGQAMLECTNAGIPHTAIQTEHRGSTARRMQCVHCKGMTEDVATDPFVRRDDAGRGGSLFMHKNVSVGDKMVISYPVNLFSLDLRAKKHLFLAGDIGITPFLSQIKQCER